MKQTIFGTYLGSYKITPNSVEIEADCYGNNYPAQMQTLEQEGFNSYCEIETVLCGGVNITDYLSDNLINELTTKCNEK